MPDRVSLKVAARQLDKLKACPDTLSRTLHSFSPLSDSVQFSKRLTIECTDHPHTTIMFHLRIPSCMSADLKALPLTAQPLSCLAKLASSVGFHGTLSDAPIVLGVSAQAQYEIVAGLALPSAPTHSDAYLFVHPDYADIGFERRLVDTLSQYIHMQKISLNVHAYSSIDDNEFTRLFGIANVHVTSAEPHTFVICPAPE